jgi:hypothetical protein
MYPLLLSVIAGLVISIFFALVKYRDDMNKQEPIGYRFGYIPLYMPIGYQWVTRFVSNVERRWFLFFSFFTIPYVVILALLVGILQKYFNIETYYLYLLLTVLVASFNSEVFGFIKSELVSEKILHLVKIIIALLCSYIVGVLGKHADFRFLAPSVGGLFDNLWSSLIVASLVLIYTEVTNPRSREQDKRGDEIMLLNKVVRSYNAMRFKYGPLIDSYCNEYKCSKPILFAVLIYEDMNRPRWFRKIENGIVRATHLKLTVGLAQVRSDKPLSDGESIIRAAKILEGSVFADSGYGSGFVNKQQLGDILVKYNDSDLYTDSIAEILAVLRQKTDVFDGRML